MRPRTLGFAVTTFAIISLLALLPINKNLSYHSAEELEYYAVHSILPPVDPSLIFPPASSCDGCHSSDPNGIAMFDSMGNDLNIFDDWSPSMMANSAKDPFWRAKVSHEVLTNPSHSLDLQTKCTSCHAPMGHYTAILRGAAHYTMDELLQDTIGLEGVSCGACHQISPVNLGEQFSGEITYDTNRIVYGPYPNPFGAPMTDFVGFEPIFSEHINDAGICASCHSLVTQTVDLDGNYTGATFVEQATYHEWLNSRYETEDVSCQSCHLPQVNEPIVISANYAFLEGRMPYGIHEMAGANTFMLQLMRDNKEQLDIQVEDSLYNDAIAATFSMLQEQSLDLELNWVGQEFDTTFFDVVLHNKAGHKLPSGYPSRRMVVEFMVVESGGGDTVFHSGALNEAYEVIDEDLPFEPHYDAIRSANQAQIYEMVLGDVNGNFTTVLERASESLKDNRLAPEGFSKAHEVYDTTLIVGAANTDPDFNIDADGNEGSGADIVHYHLAVDQFDGLYDILVNVYYQSLPPRWMEEIFMASTPEIDTFKHMYYQADHTPVLMASARLDSLEIRPIVSANKELATQASFQVFPNPTSGQFEVVLPQGIEATQLHLFDLTGKLIYNQELNDKNHRFSIATHGLKGVHLLKIRTSSGVLSRKIIFQSF